MSIHAREVISRSKAVVINTVVGCFLATLMYYCASLFFPLAMIIAFILLLALLTLYFTMVNYAIGIFFNSIFIVMFCWCFILLGLWAFISRVFDIVIGAVTIIIVSFFFRKRTAKETLLRDVDELLNLHDEYIKTIECNQQSEINHEQQIKELVRYQRDINLSLLDMQLIINKKEAKKIKDTLAIMQELTMIYNNLADLRDSDVEGENLRAFCLQKIAMFFTALKQKYQP